MGKAVVYFICSIAKLELTSESSAALNPRKSVRDIIMLPLRAQHSAAPRERLDRVKALLDSVGLPQRHLTARPAQLSGGQRQRVGIARALAIEPDLLFLDEPTASLDVSVQARILDLLSGLQERLGIAQIMISHNLGVIRHAADRVAVMYLGEIVESGTATQLFADPADPYTQALFSAIPQVGGAKLSFQPDTARARGEAAGASNIPTGCSFHPRCPRAHERCRTEAPRTVEIATGHTVGCHLYGDSASGSATA